MASKAIEERAAEKKDVKTAQSGCLPFPVPDSPGPYARHRWHQGRMGFAESLKESHGWHNPKPEETTG